MAVKRYDGSAWQTVAGLGAQGPAATSSSIATWVKTASGGETSLSGNDDSSQALSYTVGQELVFINGTLLKRGSDYTATNGTSITGLTALAANDVATVWTVNAFSVTNAISNNLVTTTGDIIYASAANTPARLAIGSTDQVLKVSGGIPAWGAAPAASFVGCSLYASANISIANDASPILTWDTERFDTDAFHSTSSNTSRITIPSGKGGKYLVIASGVYAANSTGYRAFSLKKNGSTSIELTQIANLSATIAPVFGGSTIIDLVATDYLEIGTNQTSGGNLNFLGGITYNQFAVQYLGA
jgi:hypothetical protein